MADLWQLFILPITTATETLVGGTVDFYAPGTTGDSNRKDVYVDSAETTVAANPYTLGSNATAELFGFGLYHVVIKNSAGVVQYDFDYIPPGVEDLLELKRDAAGTTTGDDAAAGEIGEYLSVTQITPQYATSGVVKNITSLSLAAGDWDVSGSFGLESGVETVVYFAQAGFSTTSSGSPSFGSRAAGIISVPGIPITTGASGYPAYTVPTTRVSIATTTVIYLNGVIIFTAGTIGLFGAITARRAR